MGQCMSCNWLKRVSSFFINLWRRIKNRKTENSKKNDDVIEQYTQDIVIDNNVIEKNECRIEIQEEKNDDKNLLQDDERKTDDLIPVCCVKNEILLIENSERFEELYRLHTNLVIISQINENQKLWLEDGILSIDASWIPIISRTLWKQSRDIIIPFISSIIRTGSLDKNIKYNEIYETFLVIENGINMLKKTYSHNENEFDSLINIIRETISKEKIGRLC